MRRPKNPNFLPYVTVFCLVLVTVSCTTPPPSAKPGTPAFYWQAARETFAAGDYIKTSSHLEELCKKESEFTARARPWALVLNAGMARAYNELANNFEYGAKANTANPVPFRTRMATFRGEAARHALLFTEGFLRLKTHDHTQPVPLAFAYPAGSVAKPVELTRIATGIMLPEPQLLPLQKRMLERGVLMVTFEAVGAPEDAARTQEIFKAGSVEVPHDVFAVALAKNFYELAWIFAREKLDKPDRVELLCKEGLDALKSIKTQTKESKKIASDLEKMIKSVAKPQR